MVRCKITKYHQLFIIQYSLVCKNLSALFHQHLKASADYNLLLMPDLDQSSIKIINRIRIFQLCCSVDFFIVFIYLDPRRSCCKSGICLCIPLHWCPRIITAYFSKITHHLLRRYPLHFHQFMVSIDGFQVTVI